jgi:hypothetical protein
MTKEIYYNVSFYAKSYTYYYCSNAEFVSDSFNVASLKLYYRILFTEIGQ